MNRAILLRASHALFIDKMGKTSYKEQPRLLWNWHGGEKPLGAILAAGRSLRGLSQAALAARLSLSVANLSRIENGRDLRVSTLLELARALKLEPVLVPKEHLPAIRNLLDQLEADQREESPELPRFG